MLRTKVNLHCVDGKGNKTRFIYEARDNNPTDADVLALVASFAALTDLGIEDVTVTRRVVGHTATAAAATSVRVRDTASLQCHKGAAYGGVYSFGLAGLKDTLVNPDGTLVITNPAISSFLEHFDDGTGILAVAGNFTVSDGEELAENGADPTLPSGYTQISGQIDGSRR